MESSYRGILKSTSLIGGASLITIVVGILRTKIVAVLLGPSGVGLLGVYSGILGMVSSVSSMGLASSGVREIAEAQATGDTNRLLGTIVAVRRASFVTGLVGMLAMVIGSLSLSRLSFGTSNHVVPIALLGLSILFGNIAMGQLCLLQGTRRIYSLVKVNIAAAISGLCVSVPCYYYAGKAGIVPSLILISAAALVASWWYSQQNDLKQYHVPILESVEKIRLLLGLGFPLMLAGLLTALSGYIIPVMLLHRFDAVGVGMWQAAFTLSTVLVGFVLNAMSTDYYPRLTAASKNHAQMSEEVNSQTEISLLLSVPGLAASIVFAPIIIQVFYTGEFRPASEILRWSVLGVFGKIVSWPLGFILLAKGMGKLFLAVEAFSNLLYLGAIYIFTRYFGLQGTGIAFFVLYVVITPILYVLANRISDVRWTRTNLAHIVVMGAVLGIIGIIGNIPSHSKIPFLSSVALLVLLTTYSFRRLSKQSGVTYHRILGSIIPRRILNILSDQQRGKYE